MHFCIKWLCGHTLAPFTYIESTFEGDLLTAGMNRRNDYSEENLFTVHMDAWLLFEDRLETEASMTDDFSLCLWVTPFRTTINTWCPTWSYKPALVDPDSEGGHVSDYFLALSSCQATSGDSRKLLVTDRWMYEGELTGSIHTYESCSVAHEAKKSLSCFYGIPITSASFDT